MSRPGNAWYEIIEAKILPTLGAASGEFSRDYFKLLEGQKVCPINLNLYVSRKYCKIYFCLRTEISGIKTLVARVFQRLP